MTSENTEFSVATIPDHQMVPWPRVAAVSAMVAFSLPTFVTGLEIYQGLSPVSAAWALFIGSALIFTIGYAMGFIGSSTHMSSYLLVRIAFGDKGAGIVNIAFAISLLGWFGVNINLFTEAAGRLFENIFGLTVPAPALALLASLCMTVTTLIGFRAINLLATAMVPVLAVVTFLLVSSALESQSLGQIFAVEKTASLTFGEGVSAVVGAIIVGAIILPDITRFIRHWTGTLYTSFISYMVVQLVVMGAAGLAAAASGQTEILDIMLVSGIGWGAFVIVIAGSWVLNSLNLYSAVLSIKATFGQLGNTILIISLGAIGVIAALMNILDYFITFLFYLSVVFVPVAGVVTIDYFFIRRSDYKIETLTDNRNFNIKGFIAWAIGALASVIFSEGIMPSPTHIAALDAAMLSAGIYALIAWGDRNRGQPRPDIRR